MDYFEIEIEDKEGFLRNIIVTDYSVKPGYAARSTHWENGLDVPGSGPLVEDVVCGWSDTKKPLTDEEYERYEDLIIKSILTENEYE